MTSKLLGGALKNSRTPLFALGEPWGKGTRGSMGAGGRSFGGDGKYSSYPQIAIKMNFRVAWLEFLEIWRGGHLI